jgi:hypothetical protein
MMTSQTFGTIREAIHHTATASGVPMKSLAADLDLSPSNLSMRTTLGTDGIPFPADDRLIRLQKLTGDHSILATMADALGYELHPKQERLPELVASLIAEHKRLNDSVQLVLATPWVTQTKAGKR